MEKGKKQFIIRDLRKKDKYSIDDEYLNTYARICGVFGTATYNSLCRHSSSDGEAFPGVDLMAEQHGINRKSILKGLKNLSDWNIILILKERDPKTKRQKNNVYVLLDRSQWKHVPSPSQGLGAESFSGSEPSPSQGESRVPQEDCKDTQIKDTQLRDIATDVADPHISCKIQECKKEVEAGKEYCKIHQPMDLKHFLEWCKESNQKHINIIGEWAETVKPDFRTQGQWTEYIKRNARPASNLVPFDHDQLEMGFEKIKKGITEKWLTTYTLETLYKFVTGEKITQ